MEQVELMIQAQEIQEERGVESRLTDLQNASLAMFEDEFMHDENDHPWWPFFNGGARDETGAVWSVYNRWSDETRADGWKVAYCPPEEEFFAQIEVNNITRSVIKNSTNEGGGLVVFQLHIRSEMMRMLNNDVLNLLVYYSDNGIDQAKLHMWNQMTEMTPLGSRPI